jgi:hypothetical protein
MASGGLLSQNDKAAVSTGAKRYDSFVMTFSSSSSFFVEIVFSSSYR